MAVRKGSTLRAQWLGKQLRELRESAKLTLKDAGDYIQRDPSSLSRMEQGITPMRVPDVLTLLNLYGVSDARLRDGLERLSRDIWQKNWWDGYSDVFTGRIIDHAWLESRAQRLRSYDAMVVPGLLQTRRYAEAVIGAADPHKPKERIARWAEFRLHRQRVLSGDCPLRLSVILDEAVFYRAVGGPEVLRDQLGHLVDLAQCSTISIRVLPFRAGVGASPEGPFTIFDMPDPYPDVAYIETRAGALYVEGDEAAGFAHAYASLDETALAPDESVAFIRNAAEQTI
ncbi:transcriptional regulator [Sphaerisporangium rufum]|uniref:Transcriptional regulator n=1 Tax=Sphaerisporangium rufum TaxID=1381558 RepID=A0A919R1C2_9ACTN|nr:helix-turn-helix transcriptional regulator [Sphaerisporangium rufum]GII77949.1 transcriptional regulator [Sphaerisporangium rufum]